MASRAPTLVKPKPKAKVKAVTKNSLSKNPTTKTVSSKAKTLSATKVARPAKPATKVTASSAKVEATKPLVTKPKSKLVKTSELKAPVRPATKVAGNGQDLPAIKASSALPKTDLLQEAGRVNGAASFEQTAPKPRRRTKGEIRTRIYWAVFNQALKRVAVFEFDQKDEAEKRAVKLAKASGEHHFIQKIKAIVQ